MKQSGIEEEIKNDPICPKQFSWMEIYATSVAAFSFLCIGLLRAYTSPAISSMKENPEIFNTTSIPEKEVISWIASSPPLASFIGTLIAGPLLQFCGRQKTLLLLTLPYIAGWGCIGFAANVAMILVGRMLTGLAGGISTASAQLYVSECVRPEERGVLGFFPSMMLALGVLLGFSASTIEVDWRELALIMGSLPLILLFMTLTIPESPPWLLIQGRAAQATKNLERFRPTSTKKTEIVREIEALQMAVSQEKRAKRKQSVAVVTAKVVGSFFTPISSFLLVLRKRRIWLPAFIAVFLMMFQQLSGANVIIFFLSVILKDAEPNGLKLKLKHAALNNTARTMEFEGFYLLDHSIGAVLVALVQFCSFFLSLPLIDRIGRKVLLIISANLMALSLGVLGFYFYANSNSAENEIFSSFISSTYCWLPLTCLCVFIAAYSIGFGPVPFLIMSEIFPAAARSYLCSLTSFSNHFFLFVVVKMYPMMVEGLGSHLTFWIFAGTCLISILMVVFVLPETKGKTLIGIEMGFAKEVKPLIDRRNSYAVGLP